MKWRVGTEAETVGEMIALLQEREGGAPAPGVNEVGWRGSGGRLEMFER